jgi:hypothetical protein
MIPLGAPFVPVLWIFKYLCPGVPQNSVRNAKYPGVLQVKKYISDKVYEHFDFPQWQKTRSRTAMGQPLKRRHRK